MPVPALGVAILIMCGNYPDGMAMLLTTYISNITASSTRHQNLKEKWRNSRTGLKALGIESNIARDSIKKYFITLKLLRDLCYRSST